MTEKTLKTKQNNSKITCVGSPDEVMKKEIINNVFDIDCQIHDLCDRKVCVHFH